MGVLETKRAIEIARFKGLDLIEVSSKTNPPICKITDYGKYQYLQEKKEKKQKTKQKVIQFKNKEITIEADGTYSVADIAK